MRTLLLAIRAIFLASLIWLAVAAARAQPVLDSHVPTNTVVGGTTITTTLTTDGTAELVRVAVVGGATTTGTTVSLSGCSLTWTSQTVPSIGSSYAFGVWYAYSATALAGCTVTATFTHSLGGNGAALIAWAWKGVLSTGPLDPNPGFPVQITSVITLGSCTNTMGGTFSTTNTNSVAELIVASSLSIGSSTPCNGETKIGGLNEDGDVGIAVVYKAYTTAQTGARVAMSASGTAGIIQGVTSGTTITGRSRLIQ